MLYGSVQWNSRLRTLLELMRTAMEEPDYPGALYLLLVLHYIEQECIAESSAVARPHNKTVERICAYLAANYRQKFSLSEVAARFYLSPYYLSRCSTARHIRNDGFFCGKQDAAQRAMMSACGRRGMPHGTMLCSVQHVPEGDTSFTNKTPPVPSTGTAQGVLFASDALCAAGQGLSP